MKTDEDLILKKKNKKLLRVSFIEKLICRAETSKFEISVERMTLLMFMQTAKLRCFIQT